MRGLQQVRRAPLILDLDVDKSWCKGFFLNIKETVASTFMFMSVGEVEKIIRIFCFSLILCVLPITSTISIGLFLEGPETSLPRSNVDQGENVIGSEGAILHERFDETEFRVYSALID